jgi:hypothetical protein
MMRNLRASFLGCLFREKVLMTAFLVMAAAVWLWSATGRLSRFTRATRVTTLSLNEQQLYLSNRASIEAQARAAASKLDAARTLDATRLLAEVSAIADESGLNKGTTTGSPKDVSSGQLSVHTLEFNVNKVDWNTLKEFYLALSKRSPYIGIEQYSMQADKTNPTLLNATFQISSVEISRN